MLDGGLAKWEAEGLETETGEASTPEVSNDRIVLRLRPLFEIRLINVLIS